MKPRTKPLVEWPSPSATETKWLKANGAKKEGRSWILYGDNLRVTGGIPRERLELFVRGEVLEEEEEGYLLERVVHTGAIFLPQSLISEASDKAGGLDLLEQAVAVALEKFVSLPGTGTINLMPPLSPEWQSIGATKIPARIARRLEELPFNLHAVLATAILTVNLLAAPPFAEEGSETIYPSLPFRARHALARFPNKDRACSRVLSQFLEQDLGEIAAKVAETWLDCNQLTSIQPLVDSRLTGGG